ncbi:dynein assembly factor 4, axonemal isoform X3 [Takifugu flavidus]|uniref:dynein assembly factor 4, axonemal isoform X3 n=1 Tax=Takifugu flavidus TaxID=433684 RepID=UPI002544B3FC|nr:dynein assembly factor 4, axonemal isoform X3 [Takifugu flavidus]
MPLNFSNWSWTQSESTVYVTLPLRGAAAGKVDIVLTQDYLKVHHPPYLFEAFLLQPIDDVGSSARVTDSAVFLRLLKRAPEPWEGLLTDAGEEATKRLREKALLSYQEKLRSESRLRAESSRADSKYALKTMMKLEEKQQARIKELKETEQERVSAELRAWQQKPEEPAGKRPEDRRGRKLQSCLEPPAPRAPGRIGVTFTPRVFPTALRESRVAQEEEWLRRQAEARQVEAADDAELKELEEPQRNPAWLKDKGDKCFLREDYLGALNAYGLALRLNPKSPALYSNRAACHLKLKNLHKSIEDSSQALHLLAPPVDANAAARARAHARRGAAFCQLQLYAEGLQDYQAAVAITPSNQALQADVQKIRDTIQGSADITNTPKLDPQKLL